MSEPEAVTWAPLPGGNSFPSAYDLWDGEGRWHVQVRQDGCVHLWQYVNGPLLPGQVRDPDDCDDYIHVCDLDDYIARLQALRDEARRHFGAAWGTT